MKTRYSDVLYTRMKRQRLQPKFEVGDEVEFGRSEKRKGKVISIIAPGTDILGRKIYMETYILEVGVERIWWREPNNMRKAERHDPCD